MTHTVSIIIPTLNRAAMLPRAIDSALAQTHPCEVIVVDHGSQDETPEIAAGYGDQITYLRRDRDLGPHFCWLEGVLHSAGDFVHLQYDDDWIAPEFIETCLGLMQDDVGFVFTGAEVVNNDSGAQVSTQFTDWMPQSGIYDTYQLEDKIVSTIVSPGCALFRRQILIDALYPGRLPLQSAGYHGVGPDVFAGFLSMLRYVKVGFVRDVLASFRAHAGSITLDAMADPEKEKGLVAAYNDVRNFYVELKAMQMVREAAA